MKNILTMAAVLCMLFTGKAMADTAPNGIAIVTDHASVCMVTDHFMGVPQIPVQADGKTYYGCCQGCVGTIRQNPAVRQAPDPLTGAPVDKAQAVIAKDDAGKVYYFESDQTYRSFLEKAGKQ